MPTDPVMPITIPGGLTTVTGPAGLSPINVGEDVVRSIDPGVCAAAMRCISAWTYAEAARVSMVACICHQNRAVLLRDMADLKSPRDVRARLKMLTNASRMGAERDACLAVLEAMAKVEDDRHDLAHCLWASCQEAPRSLVLVRPSFLHDFDACFEEHKEASQAATESQDWSKLAPSLRRFSTTDFFLKDTSQLIVHTEATLNALLEETLWASKASVVLALSLQRGPGRKAGDASLAQLWWVLQQAATSRQSRTLLASPQSPPSEQHPPKS